MKIALIPCGRTEWHDEGRLLGRVELPLTPAGQQQCAAWVAALRAAGVRRILHAPDELTTATAELLARPLAVPTKPVDELVEVDLGLWTGLTESQLKGRFATAHRELCDAPLRVNPPDGEGLQAAADRLCACLRKVLRKNGQSAVGLVLRPLSFALTRCALSGGRFAEMWETALHADGPVVIECPQPADAGTAQRGTGVPPVRN